MKNNNNLISQSAAHKLAGVSRQAINNLQNNSSYSFFVGKKVDANHPDWLHYLEEQKNKKKNNIDATYDKPTGKKKPLTKSKSNPKPKGSSKKTAKKNKPDSEQEDNNGEYNKDHALTGGYNPLMFRPSNPSQLKSITEVVSKNIDMRIKLGEFIDRRILESFMDVISQTIQSSFVDLSRKVSAEICEKLDRIGLEKQVEKIINKPVTRGIEDVKKACNKTKIAY